MVQRLRSRSSLWHARPARRTRVLHPSTPWTRQPSKAEVSNNVRRHRRRSVTNCVLSRKSLGWRRVGGRPSGDVKLGNPLTIDSLAGYWLNPVLGSSIVIVLNLFGALVLGALVGYERTFRSRAAGMRTLGLVCMGSAAFTIISGFAHEWFGGMGGTAPAEAATRVIQGTSPASGFSAPA